MIDRNKARFARDFQFEGNEPRFSSAGNTQLPGGDDPLAELARIVGQDDPFRGLLAEDRRVPPDDGPIAAYGGRQAQPAPSRAAPPLRAVHPKPQDSDFDDNPLLRGTLSAPGSAGYGDAETGPRPVSGAYQGFQHPAVADPDLHPADGQYGPRGSYAYDDGYGQRDEDDYRPDDGYASNGYDETANYDDTTLPERRSRKGLIAVALILCMAAVGVASALVFRGGTGTSGDGPPLITADNQPVKVEPQNPGGVDVPGQNNAIYDHIGDPVAATTKIVSREEQPLDVNQALRQEASSAPAGADTTQATGAIGPTGGADPSVASIAPPVISDQTAPVALPPPGTGNSPTDILGEPRRVKTVSVRPDGSIISDAPKPAPEPAPVVPADPTPANATPPAAEAAANEPVAEAPHVAPPAPPRPSTRAPLRITPPAQRVASAAPIAPTPAGPIEVAPPRQPSAAPTSTSGNFAVQLAAPGSEKEARDLFSTLQRRYADLSGYKPFVRKAEVNDRTIYRLRVGPFSREDATSLCTRLQASGGQCFVARN
jgi:cell division septation protein DedD